MELHDSFGQTSVLTFTNFDKQSGAAATDQFKFAMPKGADVLEQ